MRNFSSGSGGLRSATLRKEKTHTDMYISSFYRNAHSAGLIQFYPVNPDERMTMFVSQKVLILSLSLAGQTFLQIGTLLRLPPPPGLKGQCHEMF